MTADRRRPRHLAPRRRHPDVRLGAWVITVGLFLLAPVAGAALAPDLTAPRDQEAPLHHVQDP